MAHFFMTPSPESQRVSVFAVNALPSSSDDASLLMEESSSSKEGQRLFFDDQENRNIENATPSLSDSEVKRRELEESERLAWQLMQEESMSAYQMQLDYLKNNIDGMNDEEMRAIESILRESEVVVGVPVAATSDDASFAEEENESDGEEHSSANWSYEQLLALGEAIGDVKTEKWRMRSADVISALPSCSYRDIMVLCIQSDQYITNLHRVVP